MKNTQKTLKTIAIMFAFGITFTACKPEEKPPIVNGTDYSNKIIVLNEGQFQVGNATVFAYNSNDKLINENIFKTANNRPLGDVLNAGTIIDDNIYLVVNNSNKVEVVNKNSFKSVTTIENFNSPRYVLEVDKNKAYVSSLFGKEIQIINTTSNTKSGVIKLNSTSEQMVLHNEKVYVAGSSDSFVYIINASNNLIEDSIAVGFGAYEMVEAGDFLFVACSGNFTDIPASFYKIKLADKSIVFHSEIIGGASKLQKNNTESTIYFLNNNSVVRMQVNENKLPSTAYITVTSGYLYGLGIDPKTEDIYIANAKDFTQKGDISVYKSSGEKINTFDVGIAPNGFVFNY